MVSHIDLLDDYYDRLVKSEGGLVEESKPKSTSPAPTPKMKPVAKPQQKEDQAKKKKHWLW